MNLSFHRLIKMKIPPSESNSISGLNPSAGIAPSGFASESKRQAASSPASDRVQLSALSRYLTSALFGSPAHLSKLSELTAAVSSGQYQVDSFAVSGSIIQDSIDFGRGGSLALSM